MNISENKRKWLISIAANLMLLMIALDLTIVNLALPTIAHAFNAQMSTLEWVINAYILTFAMLLVIGGKLGDIFGHRQIFIIGVAIFIFASLIGGFATNIYILIISRVMQGVGAAISFPVSSIINFAVFPKEQKAIAMGITATIAGAGQALGPSVGGIILKFLSWPWVFFVNIPIGLFAIILLLLTCPKYVLPLQKQRINYVGALLLGVAIFVFIYGLIESQNWHVISWQFVGSMIVGIIFLFLFYLNSARSNYPLFDLKVLHNSVFVIANGARAVMAFCTFVILFSTVLYMQNIIGITPLRSGYLLLCMTGAWAGASPLAGIVVGLVRGGARTVLLIGILFLMIAFILFIQVAFLSSMLLLALAYICAGLGVAAMYTATNTLALTSVTEQQVSAAISIIFVSALFSNMAGVAVTGSMLSSLSASFLSKQLLINNIDLLSNNVAILRQLSNGAFSLEKIGNYFNASMVTKLLPIVEHAFRYAFIATLGLCLIFLIITLITTISFLKKQVEQA